MKLSPEVLTHLSTDELDELRCDLEHDEDESGLLDVVEAELTWRFGVATGQV